MRKLFPAILISVFAIVACNSKYEESSPAKVQYTEGEIAQRAKLTTEMDKKTKAVETAVAQLVQEQHVTDSSLLALLRQSQNEFTTQIPQIKNNEAIWIVSLDTTDSQLTHLGSDLCLGLRAPAKATTSMEVSSHLSYSIFSCAQTETTTPILKVEMTKESMTLAIRSLAELNANAITTCTITKSADASAKPLIKCNDTAGEK
jgi:hypothetical protein